MGAKSAAQPLAAVLVAAVLMAAFDPAAAPAPTPSPDLARSLRAVCRPVFQIDGRASPFGTAFILRAPAFVDTPMLVTAHHLFGLATAKSDGMPWQATSRRVRSAICRSYHAQRIWRAGAAVSIIGAHAFRRTSEVRDIALLPIVSGPQVALDLSPQQAQVGDFVWLVAQTADPLRPGDTLHRARVLANQGYLAMVYDDSSMRMADTSGAPIVSSDAKVVGVNVAAGKSANGALTGVADDLPTLQSALSSVGPTNPP